ncbi:hypothetical protein GCM10029964_118010 [Kibdelosporangium lantanae]
MAGGDVWIAGSIDPSPDARAPKPILKRRVGDTWRSVGALEAAVLGIVRSVVPDGHGGIFAATAKDLRGPALARVGRDQTAGPATGVLLFWGNSFAGHIRSAIRWCLFGCHSGGWFLAGLPFRVFFVSWAYLGRKPRRSPVCTSVGVLGDG